MWTSSDSSLIGSTFRWISLILLFVIIFALYKIVSIVLYYRSFKKNVPIPALRWNATFRAFLADDSVWLGYNGDRSKDLVIAGVDPFGGPIVLVSNPEYMKEVFMLPKSPAFYTVAKWILGEGLVTNESDVWKFYRKAITPLFHFGPLKNMIPAMQRRIDVWLKDLKKNQKDFLEPFIFFEHLTMAVIIDLAFGENFDVEWMLPRFKKLGESITPLALGHFVFGDTLRQMPFPFVIKFHKLAAEIHSKIRERIEWMKANKKESTEEPENLMTMLLSLQKQDDSIKDEHIIDHCLTFLFAGNETVATVSSWVMYYLGKYPKYQEKIYDEINRVGEITSENINQMIWTKNIINETMRLRPVLKGISRVNEQELNFGGVKIPKGTTVTANILGNHMDPNVWENPREFIPERWERESNRHPYVYIPFSAGHRNCIGMKFAQQEAIMLLANLMREYTVETNIKGDIGQIEAIAKPASLLVSFIPRK